jgi:protein SCO1/2
MTVKLAATLALLAVLAGGARGQEATAADVQPAASQGEGVRPPQADDPTIPLPQAVMGLDVDEHVGLPLPMELQFTTSEGKLVQIGDYFKSNKPAVIAMVYYKCPVVCDVVMQKMTESFNGLDFTVGKDFQALLFSFDSTETPADAASAKNGHLSAYKRERTPEVDAGWQFHTADTESARQLADALGFKYRRLANGQFGHPAAIYIITPEGRISRYFYGFDYPSRDMKLALIDATNGKLVKTIGDRIMSFCYMFDPNTGKYTLMAMRVMQISGVISVTCVAALVGALFVGERVRRKLGLRRNEPQPPAAGAAA